MWCVACSAAIIKAIDDNYGVAPAALVSDLKAAYSAQRAAAVAAGKQSVAQRTRQLLAADGTDPAWYESLAQRALIISGLHLRINSDRRDALESKKFVHPLLEPAAVIEAERKSQIAAKAAQAGKQAHSAGVRAAAEMFMSMLCYDWVVSPFYFAHVLMCCAVVQPPLWSALPAFC